MIDGKNEIRQVSVETQQKLVEIEEKIANQMSALDNPFLLKAFECCLLNEEPQQDAVDSANSRENDKCDIYERWNFVLLCKITFRVISFLNVTIFRLNNLSTSVLPFREVFESTLTSILDSRYHAASKLVKNILMDEYRLELHLELMRSVYMMERGNVMSQFYQQLFHEVIINDFFKFSTS